MLSQESPHLFPSARLVGPNQTSLLGSIATTEQGGCELSTSEVASNCEGSIIGCINETQVYRAQLFENSLFVRSKLEITFGSRGEKN